MSMDAKRLKEIHGTATWLLNELNINLILTDNKLIDGEGVRGMRIGIGVDEEMQSEMEAIIEKASESS